MVRSGSTWQYNVTADLLERSGRATRVGFMGSESDLRHWISEDPSGVVKLHRPFRAAVSDVLAGRARVIYIHRDLRDVAASLMQYHGSDLRQVLSSGELERSWRDHNEWTQKSDILVQRYEDMVVDSFAAVRQIAVFLELDVERGTALSIASSNSLHRRRRELESSHSVLDPVLSRARRFTGGLLRRAVGREATTRLARHFGHLGGRGIDPHTLLHANHIAHGGVGSYRDAMSDCDQKELERAVAAIVGSAG